MRFIYKIIIIILLSLEYALVFYKSVETEI